MRPAGYAGPVQGGPIDLQSFVTTVKDRNPGEREFVQAVTEVAESVIPFINKRPEYYESRIMQRMAEPDRIIIFRVAWEDDNGTIRLNRGYRVQFNNAIGPYKGGLRFDPSVSLSVLKFLGFEQVFKNSLTTLPMGGAKGGSDFNPKGKSDREVMRFCQSFMTALQDQIGKNMDIPAGDIGVGAREISYLFGQHKRLTRRFTGVLTGKGLAFGGSLIRAEATGYGCVYFAEQMLKTKNMDIAGRTALVSGSGNVATYTAEKLISLGAKVLTLSDRGGLLHFPDGLTRQQLEQIMDGKTMMRKTLAELAPSVGGEYIAGVKPWQIPGDMAFPSATQNEVSKEDAITLVKNGCILLAEGANMPTTAEGVDVLEEANVLYGPGKAANAGGVAVSGLEITQNTMRMSWSTEEVDAKLQDIMSTIHEQCLMHGHDDRGKHSYVRGANIAGFIKVADAMIAQGIV